MVSSLYSIILLLATWLTIILFLKNHCVGLTELVAQKLSSIFSSNDY